MRNFLYIAFIVVNSTLYAQTEYVVVTIEKNSNEQIHAKQTDYWIINLLSWKDETKKAVFPLFLTGFSATDHQECCKDKNLILFNATSNESFDYDKGVLKSTKQLMKIILNKKKKVQTVKKKWLSGKKETIKIYLTPIIGNFCFCELTHKDDNSKIGYEGQVLLPVSDFKFDSSFWKSKLSNGILKFDFSTLPYLSLHTIQ